jgi:hypothetical protein
MPEPLSPSLLALCLAATSLSVARADSPPPTTGPFQQSETGKCKPAPVRSVERAAIEPGAAPKLVAHGTASSAGWQKAELRFRSITKFRSRDASAVYAFVACPPDAGAEVATPITAETLWNLSPQLGRVYHVVIEAATNSLTFDPPAPPKP